jgi:PBP1b-binding outer membrane lipoprotein LpoB
MKQLVSIAFLLALLVSGCSQEEMVKNGQASKLLKVTASFDQNESRTYIENLF